MESRFPLPKRTFTAEFLVGLFTLVGVLCFAYLAVNIARMRLFDSGTYTILAEFDNVSGLEIGAPAEIGGVAVGTVTGIALSGTSAVVTIAVENAYNLRSDDIASIRTKGIIGDRYVKIMPGGSTDYLKPGEKIVDTESVVDLEDVIGKIIHRMGGD